MVHEIYIRICLKSPKNGEREKKKTNHEQLGIHQWKSMKNQIFIFFTEKLGNILTSFIKLIKDFYQLAFMTQQNRDRIFFIKT